MRSAAHPICATPGCKNKKSKRGRYFSNHCNTCNSRLYRERNPAEAAFYNLKHRAKERGKQFLITRKQWVAWCEETGYHLLKARSAEGMSVDRIKEEGPYSIDNIQMLTLGENVKKSMVHRERELGVDPSQPYTEEDRPW